MVNFRAPQRSESARTVSHAYAAGANQWIKRENMVVPGFLKTSACAQPLQCPV